MSIKLIKIYLSRKAANLKMSQLVSKTQGIFGYFQSFCVIYNYCLIIAYHTFKHLKKNSGIIKSMYSF